MSQSSSSQEFRTLLLRLEAVVDDEVSALKSGQRECLVKTIGQKERLLVDFTRMISAKGQGVADMPSGVDARRLVEKMQENMRHLSIQIVATGDVIDTIFSAIALSDSDGTYDRARRHA